MLLTINGYHDNHNGQPGQGGGAENLPEEVDSQGDLEKEIRSDQCSIFISSSAVCIYYLEGTGPDHVEEEQEVGFDKATEDLLSGVVVELHNPANGRQNKIMHN